MELTDLRAESDRAEGPARAARRGDVGSATNIIPDNATEVRLRHYAGMPLYYFHCLGDDGDGTELPDDAAARDAGREAFGEMIRDGTVAQPAHMEVVDTAGRRVAYFGFSTTSKG